jgi:cation diffusion facilitator CzcD-associated flavoprotein CzcO
VTSSVDAISFSVITVAARLKAIDVQSLIIERTKRVGDQWRNRYDFLNLHDPLSLFSFVWIG